MEEGDNIQDLNDENENDEIKRFGEGMLENVNNLETVNSVAETLPSQNVFTNQTKSQFLSELYYSNQEFMEKAFEEITRNETFDFHGDNIIERFSIPKNIACLVLLKKQQLMEYDVRINKIVREVCQSILVDAVAAVKQRTKLPNNATEPLLDFMFKLTQNDFFKIINKADGPILEACRKRKQRKDKNNGVASQKKSKLSFPVTNIED
uniref:Uncharacterized protein n=1 Tax=Panagrolaimus davidi TaxID=227884 RepID=A0A914NZP6_9BILA